MKRAPGASRPHLSTLVVSLAAGLAFAGCGGGGGDGGTDVLPCAALSFDRALASPGSGDVYLDGSASTCSSVDINVVVSNLTGVFTVGFDLSYPAALIQYDSYTLGPLLQKGPPSTPPSVLVNPLAGGIQVAATRFSPDPPVNASGSESLLVLHFSRLAAGSGAVDFIAGGSSTVSEVVLDETGLTRPALFGPGHGGMVMVP